MEENTEVTEKPEGPGVSIEVEDKPAETVESIQAELADAKDKYLRLYAEFENYKRKVQKDKEELIKYSNESLMYEILPALDNLEMALRHSEGGNSEPLAKGVENTLREMNRILEKFGLTAIEAMGKPFDPAYHHAMSQIERDDMDNNTVVEELRKGYIYNEKVLRPSLVAVSKKSAG
ncbi:MAG: nucleotide exchange factor GrpE [Nitrospirae bacterium GWC2_46_6]|nr:MAG: nucleotide exchange factor GrpE [Nitrospirae bacterium GWC2_46_6]OGW19909.1 MAG: nucleotide exchange factor GrpE [Nitrospirae bacterium GWA2_46_11]OGW24543.1 MAG: nucleotide exchange factor GrpE [Nitrospirae bacterium GWB2_47_37]HAK89211.1 nucleotide exchange factor GrpE [Nitrospiraceae bacterium]HCL82056.1 nucleotide exchange factor GrpE [Nitrospiraceae bacterium]